MKPPIQGRELMAPFEDEPDVVLSLPPKSLVNKPLVVDREISLVGTCQALDVKRGCLSVALPNGKVEIVSIDTEWPSVVRQFSTSKCGDSIGAEVSGTLKTYEGGYYFLNARVRRVWVVESVDPK
ncbi:MAG: hypothetical protein C0478_17420 [Planctomyces sp.]|nr:hypothetical protein [Planctomyces sp.]